MGIWIRKEAWPWAITAKLWDSAAPVGAHSAMRWPRLMARHSLTMVAVANVLPQPGPPVSTMIGALAACRIASRCPSDSFTSAGPRKVRPAAA